MQLLAVVVDVVAIDVVVPDVVATDVVVPDVVIIAVAVNLNSVVADVVSVVVVNGIITESLYADIDTGYRRYSKCCCCYRRCRVRPMTIT